MEEGKIHKASRLAKTIKNKSLNALAHTSIDSPVHPATHFILTIIMTLQTISLLARRDSQLFMVVQWFDFSEYISGGALTTFGVLLSLKIIVLMGVKFGMGEKNKQLDKPTTMGMYTSMALSNAMFIFNTILMIPLVKSSLTSLSNGTSTPSAAANLIILVLLTLPLSIFCQVNTLSLINNPSRTLWYFNRSLFTVLFRFVFILGRVYNFDLMIVPCLLYAIISSVLIYQQPIVSYYKDWFTRAVLNIVLFMCFVVIF